MSRSSMKKSACALLLGGLGFLAMGFGQAVPAHAHSLDMKPHSAYGATRIGSLCSTNIILAVNVRDSRNVLVNISHNKLDMERDANCIIVKGTFGKRYRMHRMMQAGDPPAMQSESTNPGISNIPSTSNEQASSSAFNKQASSEVGNAPATTFAPNELSGSSQVNAPENTGLGNVPNTAPNAPVS